jgi:hypothetical protein
LTFLVGNVLFGDFDGSPADVESASGITGHGGDFSASELNRIGLDNHLIDAGQSALNDGHELGMGVAGKGDARKTKSAGNFIGQCSLGKIHGVGHGEHDQSGMSQLWPVEEVVHDALVTGDELVEFVH